VRGHAPDPDACAPPPDQSMFSVIVCYIITSMSLCMILSGSVTNVVCYSTPNFTTGLPVAPKLQMLEPHFNMS